MPVEVPNDVLIASNIAAVASGLVALPQVVNAVRRPATLGYMPHCSLALQVGALALFAYANVRLGLYVASAQTAAACLCSLFIWAMKVRASASVRSAQTRSRPEQRASSAA